MITCSVVRSSLVFKSAQSYQPSTLLPNQTLAGTTLQCRGERLEKKLLSCLSLSQNGHQGTVIAKTQTKTTD